MIKENEKTPIEHGPAMLPPFWGAGQILTWDTQHFLENIVTADLFKNQWRSGQMANEEYLPLLEELGREIIADGLVDARALYGYFPVIADGLTVIIMDPFVFYHEIAPLTFGRIKDRSIADFIRPEGDCLALQVVTLGPLISKRCAQLKADESGRGFYLDGIAHYLALDLQRRVTGEIRRGLGISPNGGKFFAVDAPGMPSPEEQKKLFEILSIEDQLGVEFTEQNEMLPHYSSFGIFIHHPQL